MIKIACILLLLFSPGTAMSVEAAELDITPLFAGYECGCEITGQPAEHLIIWANPDDKGRIASTGALPSPWRDHVGTPSVTDGIDHWYVKVPFRGVRFHGVPVTRLERWYGKGNGISGWALILAAPLGEVRRHIDEKGFRLDASGNFKPKLAADETGQGTQLVCDVSM